ncbi:MAG TPA: hydrogenase accessory protein HypB [Anaerolineae bacterium]|nr:hydrogenase accessory protein HypB [Anaerolineae bacterium]
MPKRVSVVENILNANDQLAATNRQLLDASGTFGLNIMASPGAGKTTVILRTIAALGDGLQMAVVEGDVASTIDADQIATTGVPVVQINTGGACHLDAVMLHNALPRLDLEPVDLLIVENVGNLICPANFRLGTHKSVLVASVPEGADKPYKYPGMYRGVDAVLLNKIDLLPYFDDFDVDYFRRGVEALNPGLAFFSLSAKTGEGFDAWVDWLQAQLP